MEKTYGRNGGVLAIATLAMAALIPSASASVIGHFTVADCAAGGVTVGTGLIDWLPETAGAPESSCLNLGALTSVASAGLGTLLPTSGPGTINDLPPNVGVTGFMSFGAFHFDLAGVGGFGPGSGISCIVDPGVGNSCSIPGSPFLLTQDATGTAVTLLAHGTIFDTGDSSTTKWNGAFTTQIDGRTPSGIQTLIVGGGTITSSFSGEFDATGVPEPLSMALIGGGLILLAGFKKRRSA